MYRKMSYFKITECCLNPRVLPPPNFLGLFRERAEDRVFILTMVREGNSFLTCRLTAVWFLNPKNTFLTISFKENQTLNNFWLGSYKEGET